MDTTFSIYIMSCSKKDGAVKAQDDTETKNMLFRTAYGAEDGCFFLLD